MYQSRPELSHKPPREQLPPLSSLFGSAPPQNRPAQSPYSEGHSPSFPAVSPLDNRQPATPVHPDRPFENSYFQRPPLSRHSYGSSRSEQVERLGIPPPPRPAQAGPRPESPRYEARFGVDASRTQGPGPVNGWSHHSQSRPASEYLSRDTSSSFRAHADHRHPPPPPHGLEADPRVTYREAPHSAPVTPSYPPTPASTVAGDANSTKDGLGPKIWTGTQFLPRFVRQAEVPGEGMCYFYDDGTHCKTVIDGEIVNAHWGVTKAGKPRKRLAIACITCREKKIKCDPDYPRCVQCEKFGRICKFKNAPRGGQGSPDTPPADPEDSVSRPVSSRADAESFKGEKRESSHSVSPRQPLRQVTPESDTPHAKRQRNGYNNFTPVASEASPRPSVQEVHSPSTPWMEPLGTGLVDHNNLLREWQTNPYNTHPGLVADLISVFFKHVPETAYCMFPPEPFKSWVLSASEKSADDLMLIYTILALGTVFSLKSEHRPLGVQYAAISRYACENRDFSIQLVQSRLLLSLYYFAINNPNDAWDFCGGALRAANGLRMNLEIEKSDDHFLKTFPYGLNRAGYAECRRRTFWSCYLMDRFNGFCSGHFSVIHPEDVFLRLPCDTKSFESQVDVQNPYFDITNPAIHNLNWTIGSMAYLINVASIWGDVMAQIYRSSQRPIPATSNSAFASFYESTNQRLRAWNESLPSCYTFSAENLLRAARTGKLGTFMTMHTVYHTTAMKLNRYIQHSVLSGPQLQHHISLAQHHAESLLVIVDTLASRRSPVPSSPTSPTGILPKFSSPFVGYSIVSAIDILTAKVPISSISTRLASFSGAQTILAELALFWQSAKNQQALAIQRIRDLAELAAGRDEAGGAGAIGFKFGAMGAVVRESTGEGIFEMREAIEKTFTRDHDCVYA
ncbi:hypothetical protein N431DRAFT_497059 [Stipitochalara longipes BDJ]|nr:hypothetical protein N431DRAFT_497059 [Stipitochalara longipes BDJ]